MKKFEEKTIDSKQIFEGKIISLKVDDVLLPNGKTAKREIVNHPGAVAVIPITKEGKIVLVEQYRKALERSIIEIPAGKIEAGEELSVCARRELEEETGYGAGELTYIQSFATSPGFAEEVIHLYVATDLYKIEHKRALDEDEFVSLLEVTIEVAEEMMKSGEIYDAKTAFSLLWVKLNEK